MSLKNISSDRLLLELFHRHGVDKAPSLCRLLAPHQQCIIAIGNDHTASILISDDSIRELMTRTEDK